MDLSSGGTASQVVKVRCQRAPCLSCSRLVKYNVDFPASVRVLQQCGIVLKKCVVPCILHGIPGAISGGSSSQPWPTSLLAIRSLTFASPCSPRLTSNLIPCRLRKRCACHAACIALFLTFCRGWAWCVGWLWVCAVWAQLVGIVRNNYVTTYVTTT